MGGATSEIDGTTTTVLLEAATFDPIVITRTSRRLALRTEAAARFSKGTDPAMIEPAIIRFAELVMHSSPATTLCADPIVIPAQPPQRRMISVPVDRVNGLLGTQFTAGDTIAVLARVGFEAAESDGILEVAVPTNRPDIRSGDPGVADVTEEIARTAGYSTLPRRRPSWPQPGAPGERQLFRSSVRDVVLGVGASEAWTSSLVAPGELARLGLDEPEIVITNPLTREESCLRRSLLPGLLGAVGRNLERRQESVAIFEIGAVFVHPDAGGPHRSTRAGARGGHESRVPGECERLHILVAYDDTDARTAVAVAQLIADGLGLERIVVAPTLRGDLLAGLHPTRSALLIDKSTSSVVGAVGEVDPQLVEQLAPGARDRRIASIEIDLDVMQDSDLVRRRPLEAAPVSRFPSSDLDLAFIVPDSLSVETLLDEVSKGAGDLLEAIRLFDVYRGAGVVEGSRSLAVRCRLVADDRTLGDAELASVRQAMIDAASSLGASLR